MMSNLLRYLGPAAGIVALLIALWVFSYIEDWSRDLTTNTAQTSPTAKDQRLRTLNIALSLDELEQNLQTISDTDSLWSYARTEPIDESTRKVHLVRTTRLMRYKDDVIVTLKRVGNETSVDVYSQSRVGKGDLGQNPRNIRELLAHIASFAAR